ncbi:hypothetical protein PCASD_16477 [Puccinia coronata f. sp. avenae]|uniref:Uncharacterized protein n=1 Tax=Puccinia coronata f. sp. avenae TaxID=200324 RepID=A0A2N5TXE2_9BASI|nr:hypothetical protein PCASD_16477 [Puccinia coronata f. sp. avenae]
MTCGPDAGLPRKSHYVSDETSDEKDEGGVEDVNPPHAAIRQAVHQSSKAILLGHSSLSQLGNSLFSPVPPVGTSPPTSRIVNVSRFLEFLGKQQRLTARPNQHRQSYSFRHRPVPTHHHPPAPYQSSLALQLI